MRTIAFYILAVLTLSVGCNSAKQATATKAPEEKSSSNTSSGFVAMGNEPSWVVKIDFSKGIEFSSLDDNNFKLKTSIPETRKPQDINATNYKGNFENGDIQVMVYHETCIDDMSGESFDNKVRVSIHNTETNTTVDYKGCGNYQGDYRLNDIWILTQMDDKDISPEGAIRQTLEFNVSEKTIAGFGGCNRIHGSFSFDHNKIAIGQMTNTLMACINQASEDKFLAHLNGQKLNFEIADNQLKLWNDKGSLLFKKGD